MHLPWQDLELLVIDIDGTLTDAKLAWAGPEIGFTQVYSVRDGESLRRLVHRGVRVVPLSRNGTLCARTRMQGLGLSCEWVGVVDKLAAFHDLERRYGTPRARMGYVADGREDAEILELVGFPVAVADGHRTAREAAKYVTAARGGEHVMEEVADLVFEAKGWV
jgi:3-deoxy-D-manno-octulosonate 8-phosphate phosphatase (KDO 8-P phosphatase)